MQGTRFRVWLALITAIVLAGLAAFAGFRSAVNVFSAEHGHVGLGTSITIAVISIAVFILCARWAAHAEHRLRTHQDIASAHGGTGTRRPQGARGGQSYAAGGASRPRWHHYRHGPAVTIIATVILSAVAIGFFIGAVISFNAWRLSRFVQSHGVSVSATVLTVDNVQHQGRYSTWYTADIGVGLREPVDGALTSTVYDPAAASVGTGDTVTVLVDPNRPSYAEFPGSPYADEGTWIALLVFGLIMLLPATGLWYELIARIRQRHRPPGAATRARSAPRLTPP